MIRDELLKKSRAALKAGDKVTRQQLSSVLGKFIEAEKAKGFDKWTDAVEQEVVSKHVKGLRTAIEQMKGGAVADAYAVEIALLEPYLPQLLDEAATRALVEPIVARAKGIGPFMGMVMKDHKGKVDPALVRKIGMELGLK
jgi:uncharacterized protein